MPPKFKDIQSVLRRMAGIRFGKREATGTQHPIKPGIVTLAGKDSATPFDGTYLNILRQAGLKK